MDLRTKFSAAGVGRFGSGWAWLIKTGCRASEIVSTPNQDNPLMEGKTGRARLSTSGSMLTT